MNPAAVEGIVAYPWLSAPLPRWAGSRINIAGSNLDGAPIPPSNQQTMLTLQTITTRLETVQAQLALLEARVNTLVAAQGAAAKP